MNNVERSALCLETVTSGPKREMLRLSVPRCLSGL